MTDFRFAVRMLLKKPGFSAVAVLSMAIGISVTSTTFSALDGLFMRPLPFLEARRLVRIAPVDMIAVGPGGFPWADYPAFRQQARTMEIAACTSHGVTSPGPAGPDSLVAEIVSWNYFSVLGIKAEAGRFFAEEPVQVGAADHRVVVISHRYWQRRWAGDPSVIGQNLRLGDQDFTIVGVAPKGFRGLERFFHTDLWQPNVSGGKGFGDTEDRTYRGFTCLGRLRPGFTAKQAQVEVEVIFDRLRPLYSSASRPEAIGVFSLREAAWQSGGKLVLYVLPVAGLVLTVACANVAILLLALYEERRREWATRLALGGSRLRLIRQQLTESLALSAVGSGCGLFLTYGLVSLLPSFLFADNASHFVSVDFRLDHRVLGVTLALTLLAALAAGLAPALRLTRTDLSPVLKGQFAAGEMGRTRCSLRNVLVIGQLAVSLVFLMTSGLLGQALVLTFRTDARFQPRELVLVQFKGLAATNRIQPKLFFAETRERLEALPGVKSTSLALAIPGTDFGGGWLANVFIDGRPGRPRESVGRVTINLVETNFFRLLGLPLQSGRGFDAHDDASGAKVALVNEALAQKCSAGRKVLNNPGSTGDSPVPSGDSPDGTGGRPGTSSKLARRQSAQAAQAGSSDAVGKLIRLRDSDAAPVEVIGVVADGSRDNTNERNSLQMYLPYRQQTEGDMILLVEAHNQALGLAGTVENEINRTPSDATIRRVDTFTHATRALAIKSTRSLIPLAVMGGLAFAMAIAGLFGLISWSVARRTHEIGIRVALGAVRGNIVWLVLKQGLWLASGGVLIGLPAAAAIAQMLWAFVPIVRSAFFMAAPVAVLLVVGVVLAASYIPARRAARINPMLALKWE